MNDKLVLELGGQRMSAILLMSLNEDCTAEVFKHFTTKEIEDLSQEMATIGQVSHEEMVQVIDGFYDESEELSVVGQGSSSEYIKTVLTKVLGSDRAARMLDDIVETNTASSGIDALNGVEAATVAEMVRDEHPQIIATILVHLDREQASEILQSFDKKLLTDVVLRIATFNGVQPTALHELTEVLGSMLEGQNLKRSKMGGVKATAEILNLMSSSIEETVIEAVRGYNEDLAQRIIDEMFLFENLIDLDDRAIQMVLKEIDSNSLSLALKSAKEPLLEKFTKNMSERAAEMLLENMEDNGLVRLSLVEAEQKVILQVVKRLADTGEIDITNGEDNYV
ncbi:MAG: flagellar motor switch protein FliG [Porticoccus sp.]